VLLSIDIASLVFIVVLAIVALAVLRGVWRLLRNDVQLDTSQSWGRQVFGRRKKS
jgi:predicted metal-dependent hydrolase